MSRFFRMAVVAAVLLVVFAPAVAAQPGTPEDGQAEEDGEDDGDTIVNIDLDEVVDAVEDLIREFEEFTGSWDETLEEILISVLFKPFQVMAGVLVSTLAKVLTTTPQVYPNPAVEQVHREALTVTYLLSGLAFMVAGLLYITNPIFGVSYHEARQVLPRLVLALIFASVSLPLLQYAVDFTNALTAAFAPSDFRPTLQQLAGMSTGVVLAWVINSLLLLAVVALFLLRDVYILFVAAISPLLALMWSLPKAKRYADTFIAGWFAALLIAPLDLLVLRFSLALLDGSGATALQSVSNWVFGVASFVLLLFVPLQLWDAGQSAVGRTRRITHGIKKRYQSTNRNRSLDQKQPIQQRRDRRSRDSNKFSEEIAAFKND